MEIWSIGKAIPISGKLPWGILSEAEVFRSSLKCWIPLLVLVGVTVAFLTVKQNIIIRVCELTRKILEGQEGREEGKTERKTLFKTHRKCLLQEVVRIMV